MRQRRFSAIICHYAASAAIFTPLIRHAITPLPPPPYHDYHYAAISFALFFATVCCQSAITAFADAFDMFSYHFFSSHTPRN